VETDHGKLATERQLGRCLVMVRAVFGEASVSGTVPTTVLSMGSPPPSSSLMLGALIRQFNGVSLEGNGGLGLGWPRRWVHPLFIGEKVCCRTLGVLTDSFPSFSFVLMKFVRISE
jgi:hypothetical protein